MLLPSKWIVKKQIPVPIEIQREFPNQWVQQILVRNHIHTIEDSQSFLNPSFYNPTPSIELPDLNIAVDRLQKAIRKNEMIGIWGDFDVDGQTATTLLFEGLTTLEAKVIHHIPVRAKESHGIKIKYLKEFLKSGVSVLLTCDTGISEHESVAYATDNGVDVLITDHHSLPDSLPKAMANINPQRLPEIHPLSTLSGVGVSYKLIENLYQVFGREGEAENLLDLVAMGTIADVARLNGENRYLVQKGLKLLQNPARIGLQEIYKNRKLQNGYLTETHVGFYIAPILNALGRLSDANPIVEFLTTKDLQKVRTFAAQLESMNERRKFVTEQITEAALSIIERKPEIQKSPSIILFNTEWEAGVLGIVANRLVEMFQKPTILLTGNDQEGYFGSGRSIDNLNLVKAIQQNSDFLTHFGGHAMAAGLSLPAKNLPPFQESFNKTVLNLVGDTILEKVIQLDGFIEFESITFNFVKELEKLSPFGPGNPAPIFASKEVVIKKIQKLGRNSQHVKITASDKLENFQDFIWWRANLDDIPDEKIDIAYNLQSSNFQGTQNIQVEVIAIRPSETTLVEIESRQKILHFLDYRRTSPHPSDFLEKELDYVWYQEGLNKENHDAIDRIHLHPAKSLIIYTIPPNLYELQKAFFTVRPQTLILCGNYPIHQSVNELIRTVAGMINYVIQNKNGLFRPIEIAAKTGQRVTLIEAICRYLQSTGQITILEHPDTQWFIKSGGIKDPGLEALSKNNIAFLYRETQAFYQWYLESDIEILKKSIMEF